MAVLDYQEYLAKTPTGDKGSAVKQALKKEARRFICDRLLLPYAMMRHRALLRDGERVDHHTYTCFLRSPSQLKLLTGPVLDFLDRPERLDITLLACSNGAEPYTIASWLMQNAPELDFHIHASDLHPEMVARARSAEYSSAEALHSDYMTEPFLRATFEKTGDGFTVRPEIRKRVSFSQANLLDGEGLREKFGKSRLVIAQNVLFHLDPENAAIAFDNIVSLMAPHSVALVEGMDLDLRQKLTLKHGLEPFTEGLRDIYEETRVHTPARWWRYYWGTEPFMNARRDRDRRYATAFKRRDRD